MYMAAKIAWDLIARVRAGFDCGGHKYPAAFKALALWASDLGFRARV